MAGDWIKMSSNLHECPEVMQLAAILGKSRFDVVGRLHRVWAWYDAHTSDGHAKGVTHVTLDALSECDGFAMAMMSVGWIDESQGELAMSKFDRHNGKSAKKRIEATERKRKSRTDGDKCHTECVTKARPEKRREEKRREELQEEEKAPKDQLQLPFDSESFSEAWKSWIAHRKEIKKPLTPTSIRAQMAQFGEWGEPRSVRAIYHTIRKGWQGLREPEPRDMIQSPPSFEEVEAFGHQNNQPQGAINEFFDRMQRCGWFDRSGPVVDWMAAMRFSCEKWHEFNNLNRAR